jgi:hypothetical protein
VSNRTTLAELPEMSTAEVARLPVAHLQMLVEDVAVLLARAKSYDEKLSDALNIRFSERAADVRRAAGKDTGRVHFEDDGFTISADLPKAVVWDQAKLAGAVATIRDEWKENPAHYIATKMSVAESKWSAWPPSIRAAFEAARTVKSGKPSYEIAAKRGVA